MNIKKKGVTLLSGIVIGAGGLILLSKINHNGHPLIDGFSSATPVAVHQKVPADCRLLVSGQVVQNWDMRAKDFEALARTRLRCIESDVTGRIDGAYIYQGIPVLHILEGVAPTIKPEDIFDRPLDMVVSARNDQGRSSWFSYGELTMCDDSDPVLLAFSRQELLPSKNPEKYTKNTWHGPHSGLRLIAARDWDNSRYLDAVNEIRLRRPDWPTPPGTPTMKVPGKGTAIPDQVIVANADQVVWQGRPDSLDLTVQKVDNWRRIGHGQGLKSKTPEQLAGYLFSDFMKKLCPDMNRDDAVLVVAIDGYRSLFSGREILEHVQGRKLLIQEASADKQGWTVQAGGDFFVDRCVWGLSHIIRIPAAEIGKLVP